MNDSIEPIPSLPDNLLERTLKRELPAAPPADPASLLFEDYLRRDRDLPGSGSAFEQPAPGPNQSLASLVRRHRVSSSGRTTGGGSARLRLPELGDHLFGFDLRHELGRGAFARVFLAQQADLAGRPVVLKVSPIEGTEPQTLAQLQHTHIVPVYSLHEDAAAGLRALCMPYFGGASLSQVLHRLGAGTSRPARGEELVRALDAVAGPSPEPRPVAPSRLADAPPPADAAQAPRALLARLPYLRAVAWIVARLAEGLQHAHDRGVLHRDIKPSNVLLGADGQPMLLDFNLAHSVHDPAAEASLGGTVAYMSPEHLRALATRDVALARQVDHRSDVYALGMVLYEMLVGRSPFEQSASYAPLPVLIEAMALERGRTTPSARQLRPDVAWGLESIVRKCLAPDPAGRYQRAEHLGEDLRRFLDDRPLRYAPELSLAERGRKWVRRHPRLASAAAVGAVAAVLLLAGGLVVAGLSGRLADTSEHLAQSEAQDRVRAYEAGTVRALCLVNTTSDLRDHLGEGRAVCEQTLNLFGVLERPDWQRHDPWRRLAPEDRRRIAEDTRELLLLLAGARVRLAPGDPDTLRDALALLDRAEQVPGLPPCRALWEDRAAYREGLGDRAGAAAARARAAEVPAVTARDHYLLAMTRSRAGRHDRAIGHLDEALRLNPRHYWACMQRGLCYQERGEADLALADFGACVGLWPDFAWGYFNRACALAAAGKREQAVADYTDALRRDPNLVAAYLNRALLRLELRRFGPALDDLDEALRRGRDDAVLHSGRGVALEGLGRHPEADAAFAAATARAAGVPRPVRLRLRWVYGFAVADRQPEKAREAFEEVLRESPDDPQALYGCAMLCDRAGQGDEALEYYDRAVRAAPDFEEARRFRAVLLARRGDFAAARAEMNLLLGKPRPSGASLYAAACVAALQARRAAPAAYPGVVKEALGFLRTAFDRGYGRDRAEADDDLAAIRDHRDFRRLLRDAGKAAGPSRARSAAE